MSAKKAFTHLDEILADKNRGIGNVSVWCNECIEIPRDNYPIYFRSTTTFVPKNKNILSSTIPFAICFTPGIRLKYSYLNNIINIHTQTEDKPEIFYDKEIKSMPLKDSGIQQDIMQQLSSFNKERLVKKAVINPSYQDLVCSSVGTQTESVKIDSFPFDKYITYSTKDNQTTPDNDKIICVVCYSYLNPYCIVSDNGNEWKCSICNHLNCMTRSVYEREELYKYTCEIVDNSMTKTYHRGPLLCFAFDMSNKSLQLGIAQNFAKFVKNSLSTVHNAYYICLITFNTSTTLYNIRTKRCTSYPYIKDIDENLADYIFKFDEVKDNFYDILSIIENTKYENEAPLSENIEDGSCFGSMLYTVSVILKNHGGLVLSFVHSKASVGEFYVMNRSEEELKDEKYLFSVQRDFNLLEDITQSFNKCGISLYMFITSESNNYIDVTSLGSICRLTNGKIYYYGVIDYDQIYNDVYHVLNTRYMWDCHAKLCSNSPLFIKHIYFNGKVTGHNSVSFPIITEDDTIIIEYDLDTYIHEPQVLFQYVLHYTDSAFLRKTRIYNIVFKVSNQTDEIIGHIDQAALATLILKRAINSTFGYSIENGKILIVRIMKNLSPISNMIKTTRKLLHSFLSHELLHPNYPGGIDSRISYLINIKYFSIIDSCLLMQPRFMNIDGVIVDPQLPSIENKSLIIHCHDKIVMYFYNIDSLQENIFSVEDMMNINNISDYLRNKYLEIVDINNYNKKQSTMPNSKIIGRGKDIIKNERYFPLEFLPFLKNNGINTIIEQCYKLSRRFLPVYILVGEDTSFCKYIVE